MKRVTCEDCLADTNLFFTDDDRILCEDCIEESLENIDDDLMTLNVERNA